MQDVTDLPFMRMIARRGGADLYFTEYFRVHATTQLERHALRSITENPTGRPVIAQLIGNDPDALARGARMLLEYPVAGIDLNLGCPAPIVYRKCAGGGLLREPHRLDPILAALREAVPGPFTIKTRLGFDAPAEIDRLLPILVRHRPEMITVHGRTVREMYQPVVHLDRIAQVVRGAPCPVLANGGVETPAGAARVLAETGARGVMIGRGAIRNPWLFQQIRQVLDGVPAFHPTGRDLLQYIRELWEETSPDRLRPDKQVQKIKKYLNFVSSAVEPTGVFGQTVRRVSTEAELFQWCTEWLDHDRPLPGMDPQGSGDVALTPRAAVPVPVAG